jgi:hypothetical protein
MKKKEVFLNYLLFLILLFFLFLILIFYFKITGKVIFPDLSPGENFNLSNWKLTLPDSSASEKFPEQLTDGYTSAYFYTGEDGSMIFWAPVNGGTTSGSSYPRSELRELINPEDDNTNWIGDGTHTLDAQVKVLQVPSTGKVIIG